MAKVFVSASPKEHGSSMKRRAYGWLLFTTSWVMHAVGGVMVGVAASPSAPFGLLKIPAIVVGLLILSAGFKVRVYARRHLVRVITSVAELAPGSFVLYLRPFSQDQAAAGIDSMGHITAEEQILRSGLTHEERLARVFRQFGPMITVGRPGEKLPSGSGANRFYLPLDDWQGRVSSLMDRASVILLGAGPGRGTVWEYEEILRREQHHRLVILVVDPNWYEQFRGLTTTALTDALPDLTQRYGEGWRPPALPDLPGPARPKSKVAFHVRAMIYFGHGWEPSLTSFDRSDVDSLGPKRYLNNKLKPVLGHLQLAQVIAPPGRGPGPSSVTAADSPEEPVRSPSEPEPALPEREPVFPPPTGKIFTNMPSPWVLVFVRVIWIVFIVGGGAGFVAVAIANNSGFAWPLFAFFAYCVLGFFGTMIVIMRMVRWKTLILDSRGFTVSMATPRRNQYKTADFRWEQIIRIESLGRPGAPPALRATARGDGYNPSRALLLCPGGSPNFPINDVLAAIRMYCPSVPIEPPSGIQI